MITSFSVTPVISRHIINNDTDEFDEVMWRVGRRIKRSEKELKKSKLKLTDRERRNYLVGEFGEAAALSFFKKDGETHLTSWDEFLSGHDESSIDIVAVNKNRLLKIQVKASEDGHRGIKERKLNQYIKDGIDYMVFVAVKEIVEDSGARFECVITSMITPAHIKQLWENKNGVYTHPENINFTNRWRKSHYESRERSSCSNWF